MAIIKLSKNERRRLSAFFTCLVLAFVAWVLTTLSLSKTYHIKKMIVYTNLPVHRAFRPLQPDTVDATVKGTGWDFLFSSMQISSQSITVNLKELDSKNFVVLKSQLKDINDKLDSHRQITAISPDTLYFDFTARAVKRVPIALRASIAFTHQYAISGPTRFIPDYVTLTGPAKLIAGIKAWQTDSIALKNVQDTIVKTIPLRGVADPAMAIYPKAVQVKIPVEEYTEKTLDIPVKLINNVNYYGVKVFPQKVKVTFTVALSKYTTTDEAGFEAVADLDYWSRQGLHQLPVKITRVPPFCKIVRIEPRDIDFIVTQ